MIPASRYLICFTCGLLSGLFIPLIIHNPTNKAELKEINIKQISGESISHTSFDYNQTDRISFITEASGKGSIITEIPKKNIPEARAWIENTNSIQCSVMFQDHLIYGISYWKRYGNFSIGAGIIGSYEGIGIQGGGQYWW